MDQPRANRWQRYAESPLLEKPVAPETLRAALAAALDRRDAA